MDTRSPLTPAPVGAPASKRERTRELLADTALQMFRERGYEATTMRAIAQAAGVSTGNAYYHFEGKEAFVQELYRRIQREHLIRVRAGGPQSRTLAENLRVVLHTGVAVMAPYHAFGSTLLGTALRTGSPSSPFSASSAEARTAAVGLMREAVARSTNAPGGRVGERLPELLWLAYMGVTLFWVLDTSPDRRRTALLIDGLAPLMGRLVGLTRVPGGRKLAHDAIDLLDRIHADPVEATEPAEPPEPEQPAEPAEPQDRR